MKCQCIHCAKSICKCINCIILHLRLLCLNMPNHQAHQRKHQSSPKEPASLHTSPLLRSLNLPDPQDTQAWLKQALLAGRISHQAPQEIVAPSMSRSQLDALSDPHAPLPHNLLTTDAVPSQHWPQLQALCLPETSPTTRSIGTQTRWASAFPNGQILIKSRGSLRPLRTEDLNSTSVAIITTTWLNTLVTPLWTLSETTPYFLFCTKQNSSAMIYSDQNQETIDTPSLRSILDSGHTGIQCITATNSHSPQLAIQLSEPQLWSEQEQGTSNLPLWQPQTVPRQLSDTTFPSTSQMTKPTIHSSSDPPNIPIWRPSAFSTPSWQPTPSTSLSSSSPCGTSAPMSATCCTDSVSCYQQCHTKRPRYTSSASIAQGTQLSLGNNFPSLMSPVNYSQQRTSPSLDPTSTALEGLYTP